jgi:tetratricopeptide (TPR) repeat protein
LSLAINVISEPRTYGEAEGLFRSAPDLLAADPFLSACYWERRSEFFYRYEFQKHFDDQVLALKNAVEKGYPAAHLYYKLGCLHMRKGETALARADFEKGLRREPGYGDIREALGLLTEMEKGTRPAQDP